MAVFRVERNTGYTVMSNHHLRNKELTLKAKGLLSQMLSLPEDWDYTLAGLSHIKLFRSVTALLAALVLMGGFSVTAFAGGGDVSDEPPTPVTETEPEETTGGYEPQPLTPEGNMSLVDDITGEASGDKQFITVVTKNGNYFYIIIDRAEDGENTVHFLNQVSAGFAERKGKKLIPTKDGYNLVAILPDSLTSPQLTAEWETRLTGIAKGSDSPADFMRGIEEMTAGLVKTYSAISEDKAKLFTPQREAIGTCPRCGATVYEGKKNYYCSDRACSFVMWKNDLFFQQRKKTFTKAIAAALLKDGKVKIKGMYSTKTGKTFDGVVLLADTGGKYVNFRVEQNRK